MDVLHATMVSNRSIDVVGDPLLGFVVTEQYALRALRGEAAPSWVPPLSELAIGVALAMLVLGPALEFFFRAHAEVFARMRVLQPVRGVKGWRTDLKIARYIRRVKKQVDETRKNFDAQTDRLNELNALLAVAERAGLEDVETWRTEIEEIGALQREQREEFERLVAQRTTQLEDYKRKLSELQSSARVLSKIRQEATVESLLPGPNSSARLARLAVEIRQISETVTSGTDSADEITEQPAGPNND
jgi:hypothetical protein